MRERTSRSADDAGTPGGNGHGAVTGVAPAHGGGDGDDADRLRLEGDVAKIRRRLPEYPMRHLYILMAVGAVDAADRTILSTVFEDVKRAFDVSDSQLGVLTAAYSVVATLSVLPFGWLADRWNRVRLIALGFLPWAIAMFWTGAAQSFGMMFTARLFLGTIEATNGPSTPSLLGDYYPVAKRSRILGVYSIGSLVGTVLGLAVGGIVATLAGWRMAFFVWGGLGLVCSAVVLKFLPEPTRGLPDALHRAEQKLADHDGNRPEVRVEAAGRADQVQAVVSDRTFDYRKLTVKAATREIVKVRTMWILFAASAANEFFMSGLATWAPTFFRRYHGMSAAAAGSVVGGLALSTVAGIIVGSRLGDRYIRQGEPVKRIRLAGLANILSFVVLLIAFNVENIPVVVPFMLASGFLIGVPMAPMSAVSLDVLVAHLRGRASALRSILRVGATALAPIVFGVLSDAYGLRSALTMTIPAVVVTGLIILIAMRTYSRDMAHAQSEALRQHLLEEAEAGDGGDTDGPAEPMVLGTP